MRAILTYHSIDSSGSPISVSREAFAGHVRWFASGAVRVVPLAEIVRDVADGDAVAITFDDGFTNFAESAMPLLRDHGLPATVFVVSDQVGGTNAWGGREQAGIPTLPLMHWDVLGTLGEAGIELGAHTRTHPKLDTVAASALSDEIEGGAGEIEQRTGRRPATFAYPYGIAPVAAADVARRRFDVAVTTRLRVLAPDDDLALLPRLDAYYFRRADGLDAWGTARFRAWLGLRAAVRAVRERVE